MTPSVEHLIYKIKPAREDFLRLLNGNHAGRLSDNSDGYNPVLLFQTVMTLPVSNVNVLGDSVWDFNCEPGIIARDIQGAKSRINFDNYKNLNSTIVFELKIALLCALQIPGALQLGKGTKSYKPHTALDIFKSTISFIDAMCARKRAKQGDEFFTQSQFSLTDFSEIDYQTEAKTYQLAFRGVTKQGFSFLRSHFLLDNLFDKPIPFVDLDTLGWIQNSITNKKIRTKKKFFENNIFEKNSYSATLAIVDFLKALDEPVFDLDSLGHYEISGYREAARFELARRNYDIYVAIRLTSRGYKGREVEPNLYATDPEFWSPARPDFFKDKETICKLTTARLDDEFYNYISHVNNSALYIIAQYTGMRPSELSGITAEGCLSKSEFGHDLITSTVIKGRNTYGQLFGDKWAAIPIVLDAIKTLRILNRFKQNPYLLSNMNTVRPGRQDNANSLRGKGISYQICKFLLVVLTPEEFESLDVSPYTLRHSLAHQMFRAAVGLPFISYQLKHFGNLAESIAYNRMSSVTVDYGGIGDALVSEGEFNGAKSLRHEAEREFIVNACDPNGSFVGENAEGHRDRLVKYFSGYIENGFTIDDIFDRMVELNFAIINVGQGYCYGEASEEYDESVPCIGSLQCNPNRCKNAVVTKANAPKWREIVVQNTLALRKLEAGATGSEQSNNSHFAKSIAQMKRAILEAIAVLEGLGEEVTV